MRELVQGDAVVGDPSARGHLQGVLTFAIYAMAALLGGALLYYGAERPFLQLREQLRHRKAVPVTADDITASTAPIP